MRRFERASIRLTVILIVVSSIAASFFELRGALALVPEFLRVPPAVIYAQYLIAAASGLLALLLVWTSLDLSGVAALTVHLATLSLNHALMIDASGSPGPLHRGVFALTAGLAVAAFVRFTSSFPRELTSTDLKRAKDELPFAAVRWSLQAAASRRPSAIARVWRALQARVISAPRAVWLAGLAYGIFIYWMHARFGSRYSLVMFRLGEWPARMAWALHILVYMTAIFIGLSNLRVNYAYSAREEQRRILWLTQGYISALFIFIIVATSSLVAVAVGSPAVWRIANWTAFVGWPVAVLTVLGCFFISVFFSGLFDPALVLRRTSLYALLVVLLTFLFTGIESLAESQLTDRFGLPEGFGTWIGGGAVALALGPIHEWLKGLISRAAGVDDTEAGAVGSADQQEGRV